MILTCIKLVTVFVFLHSTSASLYQVFDTCCLEGVTWSSIAYRCDNYPAPVLNISDSDQAACLSIIEVCCIKQTQMNTCEDGKRTALNGDVCAIRDADPGAEQFRECCQCCRLGLESRQQQAQQCPSPGLGEPCDSKFRECCLGEETQNSNFTGGTLPGKTKRDSNSTPSPNTTEVQTTEAPMTDSDNKTGEHSSMTTNATVTDDSNEVEVEEEEKEDEDKEEEEEGIYCRDGHKCHQRCVDSLQGKKCVCHNGYRLQRDGRSCLDIDECAEGLSRCAPSQQCVNTQGRYTCTSKQCPQGYTFNDRTRRCEFDLLQCQVGFSYNSVSRQCEDVNECGLGTDSCKTGERCENTIGSYSCRRIHHCGTGYTLDDVSQRCVDNDECRMGTHNCRGGYRCQNLQGTFRCAPKSCNSSARFDHIKGKCVSVNCPRGFKTNSASRCVDINECSNPGRPACRRFQRCVNTRGSFYCVNIINCPPGYEATEKDKCRDIDECAKGTHKCGPEQQCINRQGTYFCQCPRGFRHDSLGRCIDVDECSYGASICPSNSKCVNTIGSYKCECVDGLQVGDGDSCTDIDECAQQGICQQSCVNVLGTFFCTCDRGYQLRDDKRSCEDIDECTQFGGRGGRSGVCGGRCVNIPGSYKCECPEGWRLKDDEKSCSDINECKEGSAFCPHSESMCINTRGGYKCPVVTCPEGYLKTNTSGQQNSIRCKRISTTCPECLRGLISRSFNFLSFASNVLVPAPLFSMTGSRLVDKFYTWELELVSARPMLPGVESASKEHFSLERSRDFARVTLIKRVEGPQDVVLQLNMNVTNYYTGFEGNAQSHIYLYITEEDQH